MSFISFIKSNKKLIIILFSISRTPIYLSENENNNGSSNGTGGGGAGGAGSKKSIFKKTVLNNFNKYSIIDPRSPSSEYNRTPIQINKYNTIDGHDDSINLNHPTDDNNDSISAGPSPADSPSSVFDPNPDIQKGYF